MKTTTPTNPRPKMTAKDAQTFETISEASVAQVEAAIASRKEEGLHTDCGCSAYADVFTFKRWKAQGRSVRKGEKSLRIASFVPLRTGESDPDAKPRLRPAMLCLFCRCQTQPAQS